MCFTGLWVNQFGLKQDCSIYVGCILKAEKSAVLPMARSSRAGIRHQFGNRASSWNRVPLGLPFPTR
jgi:hypothetical protein